MSEQDTSAHAEKQYADTGTDEQPKKHYTLKPVTTPVQKTAASIPGERGSTANASSNHARSTRAADEGSNTSNLNAPFLRPAHEDDDGYDPYSDRQETHPLFEKNPWG